MIDYPMNKAFMGFFDICSHLSDALTKDQEMGCFLDDQWV